MSLNGTTHPALSRRPTITTKIPQVYNPIRRFIARYALQAITDYYWPSRDLNLEEWFSAEEFVHSVEGQDIIRQLGIPVTKIKETLTESPS